VTQRLFARIAQLRIGISRHANVTLSSIYRPLETVELHFQPEPSTSLSSLVKMSNQNLESTNCGDERPAWQEEGFNSHQEWQDWLNESEATDNAYDAQAEAPPPDDSDEDEGFDEEFVSEQSSQDEDDDDEESENDEPVEKAEPEDHSNPDDHSEAAGNREPGVNDTPNVNEAALISIHGFGKYSNYLYKTRSNAMGSPQQEQRLCPR